MSDTPRTDAEERRQAALNDSSIRNYAAAWPELARTLERELSRAMTNRDQFAAAAPTGLLADPNVRAYGTISQREVCDCAYNLADAMLARRSAQPTTGAPAPQPGAVDAAPTKGT